jgi:hypothetical protein
MVLQPNIGISDTGKAPTHPILKRGEIENLGIGCGIGARRLRRRNESARAECRHAREAHARATQQAAPVGSAAGLGSRLIGHR